MSEYIVDLQGFQQPVNQFVLKELATLCIQDGQYTNHLFEPPCVWSSLPSKYKSTNLWNSRNTHFLRWEDKGLPYDMINDIVKSILSEAKTVFVKGLEKKLFLQSILGDSKFIIDLSLVNCPSIKYLVSENNVQCPYHANVPNKHNCALKNVLALKTWFCENDYDE